MTRDEKIIKALEIGTEIIVSGVLVFVGYKIGFKRGYAADFIQNRDMIAYYQNASPSNECVCKVIGNDGIWYDSAK